MKFGRTSQLKRVVVFTAAIGMVAFWSIPAALASPSAHKKKALSLASVTITAGQTATPSLLFIAQAQGFFKANGVDVTYLASASSAAQTAILIGGSAQFSVDSPASDFPAVAAGAPIRGVLMSAKDSPQELAITQTAATQFNVPSTGNTAAGALAQLEALKGSHILMAESGATSGSYVDLIAVARAHGLTIGIGCPTCDINVTTTGTPAAEDTAIEGGKVQAIGNNPPVTVVPTPPTIIVELWKISPLPATAANYVATTTTMIQQHADTVQAVVNGFVQASYWLPKHASKAEKDVAVLLTSFGFTSPEEQQYLFSDVSPFLTSPYPTKASYNTALSLVNATSSPPLVLPYTAYVVPKFVVAAGKLLGVKLNG